MDQELKQYFDANFARIDERFAQADRRSDELAERIEKVETTLLGAFYGLGSPHGNSRRRADLDRHGFRRAPRAGRTPYFRIGAQAGFLNCVSLRFFRHKTSPRPSTLCKHSVSRNFVPEFPSLL